MHRFKGAVNTKAHTKAPRWLKEGRYLIALDHEVTVRSGSLPLIGLFMGFGGSESAAPWVAAVIS